MTARAMDVTGQTFGKWLVLVRYKGKHLCRCACGRERKIPTSNLVLGLSTQCRECSWVGFRKINTAQTQVLNIYKCNARGRGREWSLTDEQFIDMSQRPCHYCGAGPSNKCVKPYITFVYNGLDRINNSIGYTKENCLPCCADCNMRKGTMDYKAFVQWIEKVSTISVPEYGLCSC